MNNNNNNNNNNLNHLNNIINNRVPPCQNIMFPYDSLHNYYNYQNYQPIINIPTRSTTATLGEVGASVELLRAQVTELSKRAETMEAAFLKFEKCISDDIFLLKSTLSEHATELLHTRDVVECTRAHVKETNSLIQQQDDCIDKLVVVVNQSDYLHNLNKKQQKSCAKKNIASKVELGMVRRRLSKVEDFIGEFYQQFESFQCVKDIILDLSEHIDECDQSISSIFTENNESQTINSSRNSNVIVAVAPIGIYDDHHKQEEEQEQEQGIHENEEEQGIHENEEEDDFEKL